MGKKTRKTRWRTLAITSGEQSDSEESNSQSGSQPISKSYPQKPFYTKFPYSSSQSTPVRTRFQNDFKSTRSSSTTSENKITFNEDEYTKITTPRQDVLFKKGYLSKPKTYQTQTSTGNSTVSTGNSTGNGTPDHQSADGTEGTDLEYESQFVFPNGYVDPNGIYYINSFEPYPPLVVYNAPYCYPEYPITRSKRYSTDSLTESTSPNNEETSQDQSQSGGETFGVSEETTKTLVNGHHCEDEEIETEDCENAEQRKVKKRRRRKLSKPIPDDGTTSEDNEELTVNTRLSEDDQDSKEVKKTELKPDAKEFIPRAYQNPHFIPNFIPLPLISELHPAFLPPGIPINFMHNYVNFIPNYVPSNNNNNISASNKIHEAQEESAEAEVEIKPEVKEEVQNYKNNIDIEKIVSKLEEAAKEQRFYENRKQKYSPHHKYNQSKTYAKKIPRKPEEAKPETCSKPNYAEITLLKKTNFEKPVETPKPKLAAQPQSEWISVSRKKRKNKTSETEELELKEIQNEEETETQIIQTIEEDEFEAYDVSKLQDVIIPETGPAPEESVSQASEDVKVEEDCDEIEKLIRSLEEIEAKTNLLKKRNKCVKNRRVIITDVDISHSVKNDDVLRSPVKVIKGKDDAKKDKLPNDDATKESDLKQIKNIEDINKKQMNGAVNLIKNTNEVVNHMNTTVETKDVTNDVNSVAKTDDVTTHVNSAAKTNDVKNQMKSAIKSNDDVNLMSTAKTNEAKQIRNAIATNDVAKKQMNGINKDKDEVDFKHTNGDAETTVEESIDVIEEQHNFNVEQLNGNVKVTDIKKLNGEDNLSISNTKKSKASEDVLLRKEESLNKHSSTENIAKNEDNNTLSTSSEEKCTATNEADLMKINEEKKVAAVETDLKEINQEQKVATNETKLKKINEEQKVAANETELRKINEEQKAVSSNTANVTKKGSQKLCEEAENAKNKSSNANENLKINLTSINDDFSNLKRTTNEEEIAIKTKSAAGEGMKKSASNSSLDKVKKSASSDKSKNQSSVEMAKTNPAMKKSASTVSLENTKNGRKQDSAMKKSASNASLKNGNQKEDCAAKKNPSNASLKNGTEKEDCAMKKSLSNASLVTGTQKEDSVMKKSSSNASLKNGFQKGDCAMKKSPSNASLKNVIQKDDCGIKKSSSNTSLKNGTRKEDSTMKKSGQNSSFDKAKSSRNNVDNKKNSDEEKCTATNENGVKKLNGESTIKSGSKTSEDKQLRNGKISANEGKQFKIGKISGNGDKQLKNGKIIANEDKQLMNGKTTVNEDKQLKNGKISEDKQLTNGKISANEDKQLNNGNLSLNEDKPLKNNKISVNEVEELKNGKFIDNEDITKKNITTNGIDNNKNKSKSSNGFIKNAMKSSPTNVKEENTENTKCQRETASILNEDNKQETQKYLTANEDKQKSSITIEDNKLQTHRYSVSIEDSKSIEDTKVQTQKPSAPIEDRKLQSQTLIEDNKQQKSLKSNEAQKSSRPIEEIYRNLQKNGLEDSLKPNAVKSSNVLRNKKKEENNLQTKTNGTCSKREDGVIFEENGRKYYASDFAAKEDEENGFISVSRQRKQKQQKERKRVNNSEERKLISNSEERKQINISEEERKLVNGSEERKRINNSEERKQMNNLEERKQINISEERKLDGNSEERRQVNNSERVNGFEENKNKMARHSKSEERCKGLEKIVAEKRTTNKDKCVNGETIKSQDDCRKEGLIFKDELKKEQTADLKTKTNGEVFVNKDKLENGCSSLDIKLESNPEDAFVTDFERKLERQLSSESESPEKKRSGKKKKKSTKTKPVITAKNFDQTYDFLLNSTFQETEKTNIEISEELSKIIQRGMYSSLEEKIKSLNITAANDGFFKTINIFEPAEKRSDLTNVANTSSIFRKPKRSVEDLDLDLSKMNFSSASATSSFLDLSNSQKDPGIENGNEKEEEEVKETLYPITQAVKDWMTKTREITPEVEILKSPSTILKEALKEDLEEEDVVFSKDWSLTPETSFEEDLLEWDDEIGAKKNSVGQLEVEDDKVDVGEDVLEVYESKYGKNKDYEKIKEEVKEKKMGATFAKNQNLPYRAICCSLM